MLQAIAENAGTILVCLILAGMAAGAIFQLRRDRRRGKSACGGSCGCCPMAGACHKQK